MSDRRDAIALALCNKDRRRLGFSPVESIDEVHAIYGGSLFVTFAEVAMQAAARWDREHASPVPTEVVETARAAAWRKTQELCRADPKFTSMCAGDSDAITFAVLDAIAGSASPVSSREDR